MDKKKKVKKKDYVIKKAMIGYGVDYAYYKMSFGERILYFIVGFVIGGGVTYIFYESIFFSILVGLIFAFIFLPVRSNQIIAKRKNKLLLQFKDMLESLNTSIGAGSNITDAFISAEKDMIYQFSAESLIVKELQIINQGIRNNLSIEALLLNFGERSDLDDIKDFGNVFETCYRKGGNIKDVIRNTYSIMNDKIEIGQEIMVMVASQKNEQNIMLIMPVGFVFLLKLMGSDIVNMQSSSGRLATTIAVGMFILSYLIGKKILNIKI